MLLISQIPFNAAINIMFADKSSPKSKVETKDHSNAANIFEAISENNDTEPNAVGHTVKKAANVLGSTTNIKQYWRTILLAILLLTVFVVLCFFHKLRRH